MRFIYQTRASRLVFHSFFIFYHILSTAFIIERHPSLLPSVSDSPTDLLAKPGDFRRNLKHQTICQHPQETPRNCIAANCFSTNYMCPFSLSQQLLQWLLPCKHSQINSMVRNGPCKCTHVNLPLMAHGLWSTLENKVRCLKRCEL